MQAKSSGASRSGSSLARLLLGWRKPSLLLDRAGFFRPGLQRVARSGRPNLSWPDSIRKERVHHSLHIAMHSEPGLVFSGTVSPESRSVRAQPRTAYARRSTQGPALSRPLARGTRSHGAHPGPLPYTVHARCQAGQLIRSSGAVRTPKHTWEGKRFAPGARPHAVRPWEEGAPASRAAQRPQGPRSPGTAPGCWLTPETHSRRPLPTPTPAPDGSFPGRGTYFRNRREAAGGRALRGGGGGGASAETGSVSGGVVTRGEGAGPGRHATLGTRGAPRAATAAVRPPRRQGPARAAGGARAGPDPAERGRGAPRSPAPACQYCPSPRGVFGPIVPAHAGLEWRRFLARHPRVCRSLRSLQATSTRSQALKAPDPLCHPLGGRGKPSNGRGRRLVGPQEPCPQWAGRLRGGGARGEVWGSRPRGGSWDFLPLGPEVRLLRRWLMQVRGTWCGEGATYY